MELPSDNSFRTVAGRFHSLLDQAYGKREVDNMLYILADEYLGKKRSELLLGPPVFLSESELLKFHFALKELLNDRPIQYIIGHTFFYGMPFRVNEHVLIPRPETEELVDLIVKDHTEQFATNVLDIGTGSGCIAVALAQHLKNANVTAMDVSPEALRIAANNAEANNAEVTFLLADVLTISPQAFHGTSFDVVVSNPPYVLKNEAVTMSRNVLHHEPHLALFVDDEDPLLFYRVIAGKASHWLNPGGKLYFEINEAYASECSMLLNSMHYTDIVLHKDLQGKNRMLSARQPDNVS